MTPVEAAEKAVEEAGRRGAVFAEARLLERKTLQVRYADERTTVSRGASRGLAVRVYLPGGAAGFAYTVILEPEEVVKTVEAAISMARRSKLTSGVTPDQLPSLTGRYTWPVKRSVDDVPVDVKVSDLMRLVRSLERRPVKSRTAAYRELREYRLYVSSEGRRLEEEKTIVLVYADAYGEEEGRRGNIHTVLGSMEGYTVWDEKGPEEVAGELVEKLEKQLHGVAPRAGNYPVVLGPHAVGVLVHEAFGHLAEADDVAAGSVLKGRLGEEIASPLVTIVDDPSAKGGIGCLRYDDEGVEARRVMIVEKGVLKEYMTDRLHAKLLGVPLTGNARAESFRVPPLVRMRNTYMLPGDMTMEELLEDIKYGYLVEEMAGGETSIDGWFQLGVVEAYEIVDGEVKRPVRSMSLSGDTLETLRRVVGVSKEFRLHHGRCGKMGQGVPVSLGGPYVKVSSMTIGGRR